MMTRNNKIGLTVGIAAILGFFSSLQAGPLLLLGRMAAYALVAYAIATLIWRKPKADSAVPGKKPD